MILDQGELLRIHHLSVNLKSFPISAFATVAVAASSVKVASTIMQIPTFLCAEVRNLNLCKSVGELSSEACSFSSLETLPGLNLLCDQVVVMEAGGVVVLLLGFPHGRLGRVNGD